jgi:hypothetical protein
MIRFSGNGDRLLGDLAYASLGLKVGHSVNSEQFIRGAMIFVD